MYDIKEFAFVPPPYGGVSTYIKRLIKRLNENGIITGGYYLPHCNDEEVRASKLFDVWSWMPTHKYIPRIFKYIRETWSYKIVHSHFSLEGMLYLWTLKILGRKKIMITVHNSMVENYMRQTNVLNRFFLKRMARAADVTWIVVSEQAKTSILKLPLKFGTNIHVIPAYIPLKKTTVDTLPVCLLQYIDEHDKIMAFYGHSFMTHEGQDIYGFEQAIRMYGSLTIAERKKNGLIFCIADASETESISYIRDLAKSLKVDNDIYWQIGAIENMAALWQNTDVYVRPTCTDGDSVAVREALDMGVRVVASDVCPRPEKTIVYSYGDSEGFLTAVRSAIALGKTPLNTDETYFYQMLKLYRKVLAS